MADGTTGENLYVKFGSTVLTSGYRSFASNEEIGMVDKSGGADAARSYLARLKDGSAELSFVMPTGTAGTALWGAVAVGSTATLEWGEEGTASSKPKHEVAAIVKSRSKDVPYVELIIANVTFQFNGAVTDGAY